MEKAKLALIRDYLSEWGRLIRIDRTMKGYSGIDWQAETSAKPVQFEDPIMLKVFNAMAVLRINTPDIYSVLWRVYAERETAKEAAAVLGLSKRRSQDLIKRGHEYLFMYLYGASDHGDGQETNGKIRLWRAA